MKQKHQANRKRGKKMGAKQKLNSANVIGAFVIAAIMGAAFDSVAAFVAAAVILIVASMYTGDIRR